MTELRSAALLRASSNSRRLVRVSMAEIYSELLAAPSLRPELC